MPTSLYFSEKSPKGAKADALDSVLVSRSECRRGNARSGDRHRLSLERAIIRCDGQDIMVELVNMSGGGAIVRGDLDLKLSGVIRSSSERGGDRLRGVLDQGRQCGPRICSRSPHRLRGGAGRDAPRRHSKEFPHLVEIALDYPKRRADDDPSVDVEGARRRRPSDTRSSGTASFILQRSHDYAAEPVRLRNISAIGAWSSPGMSSGGRNSLFAPPAGTQLP